MKTKLRLIGGKRLESPKNIYTRPTTLRVREAIFNILRNRVENSNWLDLFSGYHEFVLDQIFNCNFLKKNSIVICEHSPELVIKNSNLWETIDVRDYGQSRLTFLIYV